MKKFMLIGIVFCISFFGATNINISEKQLLQVYGATDTSDMLEETYITDAMNSENLELSGKWYEGNELVAHALGSIDGRVETNSLEAFLNSYEQGVRVFEADFQLTNDEILVVRHDFEQDSYYRLEQTVLNGDTSMDINRYVNEKINFRYTPLTAEDLLNLLNEHKDAYIITDTKDLETEIIQKQFEGLVKAAEKTGNFEVLDRVIVQIYNMEMLEIVREIYDFDNWVFTLYQFPNPDFNQIGEFCKNEGIDVVTMNNSIATKEKIDILKSYEVVTYTHTVNRLLDIKHARYIGVEGIYSDYLVPSDLELLN